MIAVKLNIKKFKLCEISSRDSAINKAIFDLKTGDILIVAGKGHEKIQEYKNTKKLFSDQQQILNNIKIKNRTLSNNIKLAIKLGLDGAYIPSFNKDKKHLAYSFKKRFIILGSSHNVYEMRIKELQNVEVIFLSSIFKKNKNYLGVNKFKLLSLLSKKPFIALGGISSNNLKKLNLINCSGFAGISFFEQKKGP